MEGANVYGIVATVPGDVNGHAKQNAALPGSLYYSPWTNGEPRDRRMINPKSVGKCLFNMYSSETNRTDFIRNRRMKDFKEKLAGQKKCYSHKGISISTIPYCRFQDVSFL
jgi:hypothetical protein